ncbi:MAG: serpin family protein [Lentimicrobium sp.]|nr:serpin family protein [Lentimicrobium sp.]
MKTLFLAIILLSSAIPAGCKKDKSDEQLKPKTIELPAKGREIIVSGNNFGLELFKEVSGDEADNLMISPVSANVALSMLLNGCNGETWAQISTMLGYEGYTMEEINALYASLTTQLLAADPQVTLNLANAIWYRQDFQVKTKFLNDVQSSYDATTQSLDFQSPEALNTINGWASDKTNGKITRVLSEISNDAVMFLMNALYFKGSWTTKFDPALTSRQTFTPTAQQGVLVDMMQSEINIRQYSGQGFRAIELPYGRQNFAMVVLIPHGGTNAFLPELNANLWAEITGYLDEAPHSAVELWMPRFKFSWEKQLNDQLKALGTVNAFNPVIADLSGIADDQLYVSFVKQNTFVDVNEEGTEAAAVTTIGVEYNSLPEPVKVDKPFIFAIRERTTNVLLFIGKVELPVY